MVNTLRGRPNDPRMWQALADCYKLLHRDDEAIRCLKRAASCETEGHREMVQLARIFEKMSRIDTAARYYETALQNCPSDMVRETKRLGGAASVKICICSKSQMKS